MKFKPGDIVIVSNPMPSNVSINGCTGVLIKKVSMGFGEYWAVRFDGSGLKGILHMCDGIVPDGNGRWVHEREMRLDDTYKVKKILKNYGF